MKKACQMVKGIFAQLNYHLYRESLSLPHPPFSPNPIPFSHLIPFSFFVIRRPPHSHFFVLVPPGVATISAETFLSPLQSCTPFFHVLSTVSLESLSDHLGIRKAWFFIKTVNFHVWVLYKSEMTISCL